jgi:hypothetical protein
MIKAQCLHDRTTLIFYLCLKIILLNTKDHCVHIIQSFSIYCEKERRAETETNRPPPFITAGVMP